VGDSEHTDPIVEAPESSPSETPAAEAAPASEQAAAVTPEPAPEPAPVPIGSEPFCATGRRKTSVARVYLRSGRGSLRVNGRPLEQVFTSPHWREHAREPLVYAGVTEQYDAEILVKGSGPGGQAGAVRLGLARALILANPALRTKLRRNGFLTRDPRSKERKKYGQKGARKRFQWTKR